MSQETSTQSRRAVEALRSGVPNRDAVQFLGCSQPEIEQRFREQLSGVSQGLEHGAGSGGTLIAGDFGSGKSHVLEYLQHVALESNFVCSKVVISKETPLHDPAKVLTAAIESAKVPGKKGNAVTEIARQLDFGSQRYAEFYKWLHSKEHGLSTRFAATLFVYERGKGSNEPEIANRIVQFWSGSRIVTGDLRGWLREMGEVATYRLDKVSVKELAIQRYQFLPLLMVAAGYAGWVLLIDEVELIGRYSLRQRAKSYAEIARLLGRLEWSTVPGMTCVLTITEAFEGEVLHDTRHNDEERIPNRLRASGREADLLLASQAECGMRLISRERLPLNKPSDQTFEGIYDTVRRLHGQSYTWDPPGEFSFDRTKRIREHVKRWIHEWDLRRLYPDYTPQIEGTEIREDFTEQPELEAADEFSQENGVASSEV
ncbi:MAG: DUF2791 family P-loop domain-containing protein [Chloroflexi bacterium]|nr:DUF2791 family P-loop domain-containing protein [Chloroflexota bacterium]